MNVQEMMEEARKVVPEVSATETKARLDAGEVDLILDVREPGEYEAAHIPGAVHIPRGLLEFQADPSLPAAAQSPVASNPDQRIVVHCAKGARSLLAAESLKKLGYSNVSSMSGGFDDWTAQGLPTE